MFYFFLLFQKNKNSIKDSPGNEADAESTFVSTGDTERRIYLRMFLHFNVFKFFLLMFFMTHKLVWGRKTAHVKKIRK